MNLLTEKRTQIVHAMSASRDAIIRQAINSVIGDKWVASDLTGRGEFLILPDKTELFKFDGMELIHFMVPRTEIDNSRPGMVINAVQEFRFLNLAAE
jgi:hypothetical protein